MVPQQHVQNSHPQARPMWFPLGGRSVFQVPRTLSAGLGTGIFELIPSSVTLSYKLGKFLSLWVN